MKRLFSVHELHMFYSLRFLKEEVNSNHKLPVFVRSQQGLFPGPPVEGEAPEVCLAWAWGRGGRVKR